MLDLVVTYWVWIIFALIASGPAGYWSARPQVAPGRGLPGWQAWMALTFAMGLVVAIVLPGQAGLYFDALLFLSFLCITGFRSGAWLRRTRTQAAAARASEARRAAEMQSTKDARGAAEANAAEDARRAAEVKGRRGGPCAPQKRRPPRRRAAAAEANAAEDARRAAEKKVTEDARGAAEAKAAEEARRVAEAKAAEESVASQKRKPSRRPAALRKQRPPRTRAASQK